MVNENYDNQNYANNSNSEFKELFVEYINESFEDIVSDPIDSQIFHIKEDIIYCKSEAELLEPLTRDIKNGKNKSPSLKEIDLIAKQTEYYYDVYLKEQQLLALIEMKAIYYYKSLEISLKKILEIMYSIQSTTSFGWDDIKKSFKKNDIYISKIDGFTEVVELKNVCGNIKHYSEVGEKLKSIEEFKDISSITYREIEIFYQRVNFPIKNFLNLLTIEVLHKLHKNT